MKCRVCDVELTDENWYLVDKKAVHKICKDCRRAKRNKNYKMFIYDAF